MKKLLILLFTLICGLSATFATDYTIEPKADGADAVKSRAVPLYYNTGGTWGSVTQQIYLASELTGQGAGAGDIDAITFYYSASSNIASNPSDRDIQIFLMAIPAEQSAFDIKAANAKSDFLYVSNTNKTAGTKVYEGSLTTEAVTTSQTKTVKINFDNSFAWDGSSNLVLTVFDMSTTSNTVSAGGFANIRFLISKTETPRFLSKKWYSSGAYYQDDDDRAAWIADMSNNLAGREGEYWSSPTTVEGQTDKRSYVNKVDFSITPAAAPTAPATPEDLAASPATTSASISWSAVSGATSYDLQQSANGSDWSALASSISGTSYSWTGLSANTTYYVRVRAVNAVGNSEWSDAASFSTEAAHTHDAINFEKWNSTSSLPTSGNYYLANDVTFGLLDGDVTLTGNLNLCLNGKTANLNGSRIIVPDGKTFTLFDNEGGGKITSPFPSSNGEMVSTGLITVAGTLVLHEGAIENTYVPDGDGTSIAICISGTVELSGAPAISSNAIDFFVGNSSAITIAGALSNAAPYSVYKTLISDFTSGWNTAMGSANPADYFTSANASYGVCRNGNEARLVRALSWSGTVNNSTSISDNNGQLVNVTLASRTITSASYNTLCLPFNLSNDELQEAFGSGYDLEEFTGSSLDATTLNLSFTQRTSLVAGKPYLILPSVTAVDLSFVGVTISATTPSSSTSEFADFIGIYNPTELTVDNRNTLFLGASNTLFFPSETANMPGFRGYFSVKGGAQQAIQAVIFPQHTSPTGIENVNQKSEIKNHKYLIDGQLIIIRDGIEYNAQGIRL